MSTPPRRGINKKRPQASLRPFCLQSMPPEQQRYRFALDFFLKLLGSGNYDLDFDQHVRAAGKTGNL
jgi:hypothetical protein